MVDFKNFLRENVIFFQKEDLIPARTWQHLEQTRMIQNEDSYLEFHSNLSVEKTTELIRLKYNHAGKQLSTILSLKRFEVSRNLQIFKSQKRCFQNLNSVMFCLSVPLDGGKRFLRRDFLSARNGNYNNNKIGEKQE